MARPAKSAHNRSQRPCVVGTSPDLPGDAAVAFSRAFYQALAAERPVGTAFKAASPFGDSSCA